MVWGREFYALRVYVSGNGAKNQTCRVESKTIEVTMPRKNKAQKEREATALRVARFREKAKRGEGGEDQRVRTDAEVEVRTYWLIRVLSKLRGCTMSEVVEELVMSELDEDGVGLHANPKWVTAWDPNADVEWSLTAKCKDRIVKAGGDTYAIGSVVELLVLQRCRMVRDEDVGKYPDGCVRPGDPEATCYSDVEVVTEDDRERRMLLYSGKGGTVYTTMRHSDPLEDLRRYKLLANKYHLRNTSAVGALTQRTSPSNRVAENPVGGEEKDYMTYSQGEVYHPSRLVTADGEARYRPDRGSESDRGSDYDPESAAAQRYRHEYAENEG